MSRCASCGAPRIREQGLFCSYCGAQGASAGPTLLEAVSVETAGGEATPLLAYGIRLPASYATAFAVEVDGQASVRVHLTLGNSPRAGENRDLVDLTFYLHRSHRARTDAVVMAIEVDDRGRLTFSMTEQDADNRMTHSAVVAVASPGGG